MRRRALGFTLVEVLVALFVMAVLAAMAWQGIDGITRARAAGSARMEQSLRLGTVLTQWEQDLAALHDTDAVPPLAFDGATLRLVRRADDGVQVVAWALRGGHWTRWASPVVSRVAALQEHWLRSQQLLGTEPGQLDALQGIESWQVYFYRGNGWSNAQSRGDVKPAAPSPSPSPSNAPAQRQLLPGGVRIVLAFAGETLHGNLTRDVLLAPQAP